MLLVQFPPHPVYRNRRAVFSCRVSPSRTKSAGDPLLSVALSHGPYRPPPPPVRDCCTGLYPNFSAQPLFPCRPPQHPSRKRLSYSLGYRPLIKSPTNANAPPYIRGPFSEPFSDRVAATCPPPSSRQRSLAGSYGELNSFLYFTLFFLPRRTLLLLRAHLFAFPLDTIWACIRDMCDPHFFLPSSHEGMCSFPFNLLDGFYGRLLPFPSSDSPPNRLEPVPGCSFCKCTSAPSPSRYAKFSPPPPLHKEIRPWAASENLPVPPFRFRFFKYPFPLASGLILGQFPFPGLFDLLLL